MSIVSRLWRRAGVAILLLAALTAAGCAALVAKERELTFRPERGVSGWFTGLPSDVQVFYLPVTGGPNPERVHAWFWPHPHPGAPTLLYLHGVRWNLTAHLRRIENLRSFGFTVLAIDYRGFGESDGEMPSEESVYEDAHAAWRWVVERERDPSKRFVYGHSLGTAVATHLASDEGPRDGMGGLILEGAFTNLPEMAAALAPSWLPIDKLVTRFGPRGAAACRLFAAACAIGFAAILAWYGVRIAQRNWDVEATSLAMTVGVVYAIVPLAAIAVGLHALADARRAWRSYAGVPEAP
jgi:alpha-beta hydrolase superfamily lysophospholipase